RCEKDAVDQVERSADSRKKIAGVLHSGASLDDRFREIPDDCRKAEEQSQRSGVRPVQSRQLSRHQLEQTPAREERKHERTGEAFPGLLRAMCGTIMCLP